MSVSGASLKQLSPLRAPAKASENAPAEPFDLIVVGGGINGTGIARDAAERGLQVLMLEKNDLGAGTTAYSTRLIHGGLRYLENMEVGLVRESLRERERLLNNAPHLVQPLPLGIPVYRGDRRGKLLIRLGMMLYGLLSWDKSVPGYQMLSKKQFLKTFEGVNPDKLQGGALYYDAQVTFPERICVENALAAAETGNAVIKNHAQVDRIRLAQVAENNYQAQGVEFTDLLTGERYLAEGRVIINAAGPWVDQVARLSQKVDAPAEASSPALPSPTPSSPVSSKLMGGTQGSHIVVKKFPGGPQRAIYVEAQSDGRPFFIVPWQRDFYLIGTTDRHYGGDLDRVAAESDEIDYLLSESNRVLPEAGLSRDSVLYAYSGVRPLPDSGDLPAGKITRKHVVADHATGRNPITGKRDDARVAGLVSIVGGKLTTYRNLAEEAVDHVIKTYKLKNAEGKNPGPSQTRKAAFPGARTLDRINFPVFQKRAREQATYPLNARIMDQLTGLYGDRYTRVLDCVQQNTRWLSPLTPDSPRIAAQVVYAVQQEFARTVTDAMRRIGAYVNAGAGLDEVDAVADVMADVLGWDQARRRQEVADYRQWVEAFHFSFRHPVSASS